MTDHAALWTDAHTRVLELAGGLSEQDADKRVPATDAWTVRQLVSHMVGVDADALSDSVDESLSEQWTEHHVLDRKDMSLPEVLEEWRALAPKVQQLISDGPPEKTGDLVVDAYWHEQDLRTALDASPVTDDPALLMGLTAFAEGFGERVSEKGLPAVRLVAGDWSTTAGEGEPQVTVDADTFDLARALSGRRSAEQVRGFDWSGDPGPYLPMFSMFGNLRDTDLHERGR